MTEAAMRRFEAGRAYLARRRAAAGVTGPVEAKRRLAELLPEWG